MCVIAYKPQDVEMPSTDTLQTCFHSNPDGAGYMFTENDKVRIRKGFMTYKDFYDALMYDYNRVGKHTPFVLHFRIGTQGGNIPENTHPFPISEHVSDLQQLFIDCDTAVAHNGILSLTSTGYYSYNYYKTTTSDTMDFITQYLSLIINDFDWYKQKHCDKTKLLIERLIGGSNKFAIMSSDGHTELIGNFIYEETDGCYYSNNSYISYKTSYINGKNTKIDDYDDDYKDDSEWETWYNESLMKQDYNYFNGCKGADGWYDLDYSYCPMSMYDDDSYCYQCRHFAECVCGWNEVNEDDCISGNGCEHCKHKFECPNRYVSESEVINNENKNKK